jgi:hypothetical protein
VRPLLMLKKYAPCDIVNTSFFRYSPRKNEEKVENLGQGGWLHVPDANRVLPTH